MLNLVAKPPPKKKAKLDTLASSSDNATSTQPRQSTTTPTAMASVVNVPRQHVHALDSSQAGRKQVCNVTRHRVGAVTVDSRLDIMHMHDIINFYTVATGIHYVCRYQASALSGATHLDYMIIIPLLLCRWNEGTPSIRISMPC